MLCVGTYWESLNYSQKKQKEQFYKMDKGWAMGCNRHVSIYMYLIVVPPSSRVHGK